MTTLPEPKLHWTDHYVKYGFAVVSGLLDRDFLDAAMGEVRRLVGNGLPLEQWTIDNVPNHLGNMDGGEHTSILRCIYDQPRLRAAIDSMFGSPDQFNDNRLFKLF